MSFKLAIQNIKKSIRDYSIYFFTLVIAVAIFYTFNSLDAQSSMLSLSSNKSDSAKALVTLIGYVSIFVSFILCFLIVYSNNFLIKRRKKEIGIYLMLGMSKRKVSTILVCETFLVGIVSLVVGLGLGVVLSQFVSIGTAKLFEADMSMFKFVFSSASLIKTVIYFGIIFLLVMIFNVLTLSKNKLIDLLNANKKNESVKVRNKYVTLITFILALIFLGYAYYLLFNKALLSLDNKALIMIICGSIGTFLFFFSLSGFLLRIFEHTKKLYLKDLNLFVLKQVNNKINTTVVSTTLICLMLLLTIGILSGSMSLANAFNSGLTENNITDWTITGNGNTYVYDENDKLQETKKTDLFKIVQDESFKNMVSNYVSYKKYSNNELLIKDLLTDNAKNKAINKYGSNGVSFDISTIMISKTDYINIMKLYNRNYIDIKDDEYLILGNIDFIVELYQDGYGKSNSIEISNKVLKPGSSEIIDVALENSNSDSNDGIIVVSDELIVDYTLLNDYIIGNYKEHNNIDEQDKILKKLVRSNFDGYCRMTSKKEMLDTAVGIKVITTFIGLYLGIVFAICSATVLAIGQLSESSDNKNRYKILRQLGASNKMICKSLIIQISIMFILPLIVAIIHAFFGLREINGIIQILASIDLASNILKTSLFIVFIYGGYFLATYLCSKKIVLE